MDFLIYCRRSTCTAADPRLLANLQQITGQAGQALSSGALSLWSGVRPQQGSHVHPSPGWATVSRERLANAFHRLSRDLFPGGVDWDAQSQQLTAHRDLLGRAALVWATVPDGVLLSNRESLLLAHPDVDHRLDPSWMAAFLAGVSPAADETVWCSVRCLAAGETRRWTANRVNGSRQHLEPADGWCGIPDSTRAQRLRELIAHSVAEATRGAGRLGISLSSGLDSTVLAAALRAQLGADDPTPVCVTYGFDRFPLIDERAAGRAVAVALNFEHVPLAVDDLSPLRPALARPVNPDTPLQSPWREFKEASYRTFHERGVETVISGNFGDHLFAHPKHWCFESLRDRQFLVLLQGLKDRWQQAGWRGWLQDPGLRALARPHRLLRPRAPPRLALLRPPWRDRLAARLQSELDELRGWPRPEQAHLCLNAWASFDTMGEDWYARRHGLRVVQPYRNLELIRAMLSLPAYDSWRGGTSKHLLRSAFDGALPDSVLSRRKVGDLTPFAEHADHSEREEIARLSAIARPYLEPMLAEVWEPWTTPGDHDWALASFGLWIERRRLENQPALMPLSGAPRVI